jgi:hypothetical protein
MARWSQPGLTSQIHSKDQRHRCAATGVELLLEHAYPRRSVGIAGVTLIVRAGGGLYWLIPAVAASLIGGVVNACLFLVRLAG